VSALTVAELRSEAKHMGLKTGGRRTELQQRVANELFTRTSDLH
jgi:hypothetical protein